MRFASLLCFEKLLFCFCIVIIIGCVILLLIEKYIHTSKSCRKIIQGDEIFWNCSGIYETTMLAELDPKTNIIDFSYTILDELDDDLMSRYKQLKKLYLVKTKISNIFETTFLHLPKLTYLDLTGAKWSPNITLRWPPNLKVLKLNFAFRSDINVTNCVALEELHAAHNLFPRIPFINLDAPLTHLDLDFNLKMNLTAEELAPYCLLTYVGFASDALEDYCQCMRLHEWMRNFAIRTNHAECVSNESPKPKCDLTFSSEVMYQRTQCLRKWKYSYLYLLLALGCGFFLLLMVIAAVFILVRKKLGPVDVKKEPINVKKGPEDKKRLAERKSNSSIIGVS